MIFLIPKQLRDVRLYNKSSNSNRLQSEKGTRVERERGSNAVLAVHNDQIQLPINIQNRRNKQTYDTYAFTIDNFPHVKGDLG
jgi:hypothetical protein